MELELERKKDIVLETKNMETGCDRSVWKTVSSN